MEDWNRIVAVNLTGTFIPVQCAMWITRKQKSGKIITFGSDVAKRGGGRFGGSAYAASKGGVLAFTRTVAREVALEGISVNCVNPGPTKTPLHKGITEEQMDEDNIRSLFVILYSSFAPLNHSIFGPNTRRM